MLSIVSAIAVGKLTCLVGSTLLWSAYSLLGQSQFFRLCAKGIKAIWRTLWALIRRLPPWFKLVAFFATFFATAWLSPETPLSVPGLEIQRCQRAEGCEEANPWSYEHEEALLGLVDHDLNPLSVYSPDLSIEKDEYCQHAQAYITWRTAMIQPYIALRDAEIPTWIESQSAHGQADMSTTSTQSEHADTATPIGNNATAPVEVAFEALRNLSSTCLDKAEVFRAHSSSLNRVIDIHMAAAQNDAAKQQQAGRFERESKEHLEGLKNIRDRLGRAKSAAKRLERYAQSDPCMIDLIERMYRDWSGIVAAQGTAGFRPSALDPLRRSWSYPAQGANEQW